MMLPFHMSCEPSGPGFFELRDGALHATTERALAPFMTGPGYVLAEEELARYLASLNIPGVDVVAAVIRDNGADVRSHWRIKGVEPLPESGVVGLPNDEPRMWLMADEYVFVNAKLKELLAPRFRFLCFSEGLGWFAA